MAAKKPPLGLMPRIIWNERKDRERLAEISAAKLRYAKAGKEVPVKWLEEEQELLLKSEPKITYDVKIFANGSCIDACTNVGVEKAKAIQNILGA